MESRDDLGSSNESQPEAQGYIHMDECALEQSNTVKYIIRTLSNYEHELFEVQDKLNHLISLAKLNTIN